MNPSQLYQAGRLHEAIDLLAQEVKQFPLDTGRRGFLVELLCFAGQLERADLQLNAISTEDPKALLGVALFRQLLRAEQARQGFFSEGRLPEFMRKPSAREQLHLQASICLREADETGAKRLLDQAEAQRQPLNGSCNGQPFDELRDLDDLTASVLELLTGNGKYYWIPFEQVRQIQFHPPTKPRDLLWRQADLETINGPVGEVFIPVIYPTVEAVDELTRLGRVTDWRGGNGAPTRGVGQRTLLVGDEALEILKIDNLLIGEKPGG